MLSRKIVALGLWSVSAALVAGGSKRSLLQACPIYTCSTDLYVAIGTDPHNFRFEPCLDETAPEDYTCTRSLQDGPRTCQRDYSDPFSYFYCTNIDITRCCCCTPTGASSGLGDPQFVGLDGRLFMFNGRPDAIFNLLTEQAHQMNALFVEGPHVIHHGDATPQQGTFMGAIAVQAYNTSIQASVDQAGNMTVLVDDVLIDDLEDREENRLDLFMEPGISVSVELYRPSMGQAVAIKTPLMDLVVYATPPSTEPPFTAEMARGHLNFVLTVNTTIWKATTLHGIVGQTTPDRSPDFSLMPPELQAQWLGEGHPDDYEVSSLLGTDCRYNKFGKDDCLHKGIGMSDERLAMRDLDGSDRAARKLLKSISADLTAAAFVATARGG